MAIKFAHSSEIPTSQGQGTDKLIRDASTNEEQIDC